MTERDAEGRYAAMSSIEKLKAQMQGTWKPPTGGTVRVEGTRQRRARLQERLGIERHQTPEPPTRTPVGMEAALRGAVDARRHRVTMIEKGEQE